LISAPGPYATISPPLKIFPLNCCLFERKVYIFATCPSEKAEKYPYSLFLPKMFVDLEGEKPH
jgi:hypothetical protein